MILIFGLMMPELTSNTNSSKPLGRNQTDDLYTG